MPVTYSEDLRERVVAFVEAGGSKSEAARRFKVSRWCVYNWMARESLTPCPQGRSGFWKLDPEALKAHVQAFPDAYQRERASHFGVSDKTISRRLEGLGISRKKNAPVPGEKRHMS